ncbi:MAG: hypothetical protein SPK07_00755, partial [Coriobacteriales bacterium]|nr:hypothetical protein [Coriobacteriales bacterium]
MSGYADKVKKNKNPECIPVWGCTRALRGAYWSRYFVAFASSVPASFFTPPRFFAQSMRASYFQMPRSAITMTTTKMPMM